jgi:CubicO group peptidase (beta-lactamase class C family)
VNNTPETKFLLASVTKQFTSMAIMLLVNEGKIKLDGKISDYLPYYRKDIGEKITIDQLLNHTSGIPGYTELPGFFENDSRDPYNTKDFILKFCSNDLEFEPGADQKYNNSAFCILGAIIEELSGISYGDYIKKNIFDKVGMFNSGYESHKTILENEAEGYSKVGDKLVHADYLDISVAYAAGGLYSTVEDMYLWDRSLYTDFLLPKKWRDTMFVNHKNGFGYGWMNSKLFKHTMIHHSGGIHGFSTHIARFVDDDICIITLGNTDFNGASLINMDIAAILFGEKYEIPGMKKSIAVDEKILKKYTGEYELEKGFTIIVTVEAGNLVLQATNQPKFSMLAETEKDFFMKDLPISISFETDKKVKATGMTLHQNGDHALKKIK